MDSAARPSFGALLRQYRLARGMSQEALAEKAGLSREAVSLLERGLRLAPRQDTLRLLARTLQPSAEERTRLLAAADEGRRHSQHGSPDLTGRPQPLLPRLSSFVGRRQELAEVRDLVLARRLVTLTGAGGIGKTSLALAVAAEMQARFADGTALAELVPLTDGGLVPQAIAAALGVRDQRGEPIMVTLGRALGTSRRLLVLDNCEHLLQRCAEVAEALLGACPGLTILATSREPLRLAAEVIWRVPPLSLPTGDVASLAALTQSEAVTLFVERAQGACPGFALSERNGAAVAELCWRLDGIPLALELAAARVAALPPQQLVRRLGDRLRLLTTGSRTALPRHQTLRAMLDWSYELLTAPERTLFQRLAVFAGGFTLEAATVVCADREGDGQIAPAAGARRSSALPQEDVLGLLLGLVDRSLVQVEAAEGAARYRLLETIRVYAEEQLDRAGEALAIQAAHAAYFVAWAGGPEPPAPGLPGERTTAGLSAPALAGELDNLRSALRHLLDQGDAALGLGLAARIYPLWFERGPREEGRELLRRLLALPAATQAHERAAALFAAGFLAQAQGDLAEAEAAYDQAVTLSQLEGNQRGQALARIRHGVVASLQGERARAQSELEAGVRLARAAEAPAVLLDGLVHLMNLAVAQADLAAARAALAEAETVLPRFPRMRFRFYWPAGDLALAEGDGQRAAQEYRAALADRSAYGDPVGVVTSVLGLAALAARAGDGALAARLLGGAEGIALAVGGRLVSEPVNQRASHARVEAAARELLGEDAFAALRAEGRRLRMEQVVRLALRKEAAASHSSRPSVRQRRVK